MANWNEYKTSEQKVTWGVGLTIDGTGRFPLIAKRIWSTLADAQAWIDDTSTDSTATPGLTLAVINDTDSSKNGVYFVKSIASGETAGVLVKLGESSSAESVKEALDKLISAVGVDSVSALTNTLKDTNYLSGATTDSVADALKELDSVLKTIENSVKANKITAATFNNVAGTITTSTDGTSIALTADTSDVKVADDFTTTTYPTFSGATAISVGDTVSNALNDVEKSVSGLASQVIADETSDANKFNAVKTAVGLTDALAYSANTTSNYISAATSVQDALTKLDTAVKANKDAETKYTISALTATEIEALEGHANIKEAYHLLAVDKDGNETATGDVIKIYKDSSLSSVTYSGQTLYFTYIKADGTTETVPVDMSEIIIEKEFGSGITVTNHVAHGVVDATSESFLTVGTDGFKLSGVQTAIDNAAASAKTVVTTGSTTDGHVTVTKTTDDTHDVYTITTSDIASASALTQEVADRTSGDTRLQQEIEALSGNSISGVVVNSVTATVASNVATVTIDGADVKLDDYAKGTESGAVVSTDSVNAAIAKLENQITAANDSATEKINALDYTDPDKTAGQVVTSVTETNGVISVSRKVLTADEVSASTIASSTTTVAVTGSTVEDQIESLAKSIQESNQAQKSYKIVSASTDDTNVREAYKIQVSNNGSAYADVADSATIKIYKDSSLMEVYLGSSADTIDETSGVITKVHVDNPQSLNFKYQLKNGTYSLVKIDVSKFLAESEFKDGLQVSTAGEVSVKVDSASETYLSVSSAGVKVAGIADAINNAKTEVTGTEGVVTTGTTTTGGNSYTITADGSTIKTKTAITSATTEGATPVIATGTSMDAALQTIVNEILNNEEVDSEAIAKIQASVGLNDNLEFKPSTSDKYISGASNVTDALDKLDAAIKNASASIEALDYEDTAVTDEFVTEVDETNGVISVKRGKINASGVVTTAIASSTTTVAVSGTNVADQIASLGQTIKSVEDNAIDVVSGNGITVVESGDNNTIHTVSVKLNANTNEMLTVDENGLNLSTTWDCGEY